MHCSVHIAFERPRILKHKQVHDNAVLAEPIR